MTILREQAERILRQAQESRLGIRILITEDQGQGTGTVTPSLRAKQILYRFRREIGDVELLSLQIHLYPKDPNHRLLITKGKEKFESGEH